MSFFEGGKSSNVFSRLGRRERECQTLTDKKSPWSYCRFSSWSPDNPLGSPQLRVQFIGRRTISSSVNCLKTSLDHHQRCAMLLFCGCVWFPPIIFIGTHSLTLVETDSA
ncbi:hypothetical protein SFRURICE_009405 [Spodoptera frugiperda]|nr:hypothetical protein SFRURICE_009405 [Spodoptera frugiperda]